MTMNLTQYATLVFDCDGVVLDSNKVKTEAFRTAALPWGAAAAEALVAYHVANGGISRYAKFAYFIDNVLPEHTPQAVPGRDGPDLDALLTAYAEVVRDGLMSCDIAEGLEDLRAATSHARWLIVSGGDQTELRAVFAARGLAEQFDGGIFGSPDTKEMILTRETALGSIRHPALFLGDSRYDQQAAEAVGLDFLFVSGWSEMSDWRRWCTEQNLKSVAHLCELTDSAQN